MNRHIIKETASLLDALRQLNSLSGEVMTLFAINNADVMTGTITDGDIRRKLIDGANLSSSVKDVMNQGFKYLKGDTIDVIQMRQCRQKGISLLPHLDNEGKIIKIYDLTVTHTILPISAILMAGGKGERLRPLTDTTPKPLLKVADKAIIDYNIEALAAVGITDITVTTRYLADKIQEHFSQPIAGVEVKCVEESIPMGTIGAASIVKRGKGNATLVMNSDLLTTISFEDMYLHHIAENADITIATIPYSISVPYAIIATDGKQVSSIEEKPSYSYYANAGIYIISNELLDSLPDNMRTDATDLIEHAIDQGKRVTYFTINGTWIDIGTPTDFKQAQELMRHHNDLTK